MQREGWRLTDRERKTSDCSRFIGKQMCKGTEECHRPAQPWRKLTQSCTCSLVGLGRGQEVGHFQSQNHFACQHPSVPFSCMWPSAVREYHSGLRLGFPFLDLFSSHIQVSVSLLYIIPSLSVLSLSVPVGLIVSMFWGYL